ncbi:hypothetical protein [Pseudomonas sp. SO81]|uniref:hypothetical protein n=1 Tax=Pseudomonas sp. SO81 TaxID=2983246 RepID=UPI0025A33223|nr:hypothetical protein [Pseudomonas sp. SO81]WJN61310.1 hypothetical protein OH686_21405 [Pseudomonas sp. SO81]
MSRSGYSDDCGGWSLICWRGAVNSAIKGKRGQQALREIRDALDAMPVKELAAESLVTADGQFCTLGALGAARGMPLDTLIPDDPEGVAEKFGIATAMVREIVYENDECGPWQPYPEKESPAARWKRMRNWVDQHILEQQP